MKRRRKGTGGLAKRADGTYQGTVRYYDDAGKPKIKYFSGQSRRDVENRMKDFRLAGAKATRRETVDDIFQFFLKEGGWMEQAGSIFPKTIEGYRRLYELHVQPAIGTVPIERLSGATFDLVAAKMIEAGRSAYTARNMVNMAKAVLREARRQGFLPQHWVIDIAPVTLPKHEATTYAPNQVVQLVEAIDPPYGMAALLGGFLGLREAEICALLWADFNSEDRTLTVSRQYRPKSGGGLEIREGTKGRRGSAKKRTVPLPDVVANGLLALPRTSVWIFPAMKDAAKPVSPSTLYKLIKDGMARAGLPEIRVHDLRHSFANALKQNQVDIVTISRILGHSSPAITRDIYLTASAGEMRKAVETLRP